MLMYYNVIIFYCKLETIQVIFILISELPLSQNFLNKDNFDLWIFLSARLLIPSESKKTFTDVSMKKWFLPVFFSVTSFLFVCICLFLRRETVDVNLNQQDLAQRQLLSNPLFIV